jgi:hypothetical protein
MRSAGSGTTGLQEHRHTAVCGQRPLLQRFLLRVASSPGGELNLASDKSSRSAVGDWQPFFRVRYIRLIKSFHRRDNKDVISRAEVIMRKPAIVLVLLGTCVAAQGHGSPVGKS